MMHGPEYLMETQEVILVSITHRTNVFGFLATGDEVAPGNWGIKDVVMSLMWIQAYIKAFGGDPAEVTLMGHGGGAVISHYLTLLQSTKGLFKNAIMMSGSVPAAWAYPTPHPRDFANMHARQMGINEPEKLSSQELVDIFRATPAEKLINALVPLKMHGLPLTNYLPVVEPKGTPNAVIIGDPLTMLKNGDFQKVPVMITFVDWDGINFVQPFLLADKQYTWLNENMYSFLPIVLYMDPRNLRMTEIVDKVRFKYFGSTGFLEDDAGLAGLIQMASDLFFGYPAMVALSNMGKRSKGGVFGFEWRYKGADSMAPMLTGNMEFNYKSVHGDDLFYLIKVNALSPGPLNEKDAVAQKLLMDNILNFCRFDSARSEPWLGKDPRLAIFRNDNETVIGRDSIPAMERWKDLEFWDEIMAIYVEGMMG